MKKIGKIFGVLGILCFLLSNGYTQDSATMHNFNYIRDVRQAQFDDLAAKNGGSYQGIGYKGFKRWEHFWGERLWPSGSYEQLSEAMSERFTLLGSGANYRSGCDPTTPKWQPLGPTDYPANGNRASGVGRVTTLEYDPNNSNTMLAGTMTSGLWKTTDAGENWFNLNTDFMPFIGVASIAIDPNNSNTIYIGTGTNVNDGGIDYTNSIGIYKSTNGGQTWQPSLSESNNAPAAIDDDKFEMGKGSNVHINRVIINPNNSNIVMAAVHWFRPWSTDKTKWGALYRSTDAGATWNIVERGFFWDIEFKPGDPNTVYASGKDIFKSTNGGATWSKYSISGLNLFHQVPGQGQLDDEGSRALIAVTPAAPDNLYICAMKSGTIEGIWVSYNSGGWFTKKNAVNHPGAGRYHFDFSVSPLDPNKMWLGGVGDFGKSSDGGDSFDRQCMYSWYCSPSNTSTMHPDICVIRPHPGIPNLLFVGNDAGVVVNANDGEKSSWVPKCKGLGISMLYKFGLSSTVPVQAAIGMQDDTQMHYDGAGNWKQIHGSGDGMECIIDYSDPDIIYVESQNGGIVRSINGGSSFTSIKPSNAGKANWVTPYIIHPTSPNILLSGYQEVHKTTNRGTVWSKISTFDIPSSYNKNNTIKTLVLAPSDPDNTIYVGFEDGKPSENDWNSTTVTLSKQLYKTTDGGGTWTDITPAIPGHVKKITSILVHPTNPNKVWITYSGFKNNNWQNKKVYVTTDGGTTWNDYTDGLTSLPANTIVYDPTSSNESLYLGTDAGVYYRNNTMASWEKFNTDLPNTIIRELEINPVTRTIYAATYGRGMWVSKLRAEYDNISYTASTSGIWTPNNNPIKTGVNLVYIKNELRVAAGVNLIIKDMNIEMGPGANFILEPGAKLSLDNTHVGELEFCYGAWDLEIKPGAEMDIQQGSYVHMSINSSIKDDGKLIINSGSVLEIHQSVTASVRNGGEMTVENNGEVLVHHDGLIHVEFGGVLNIKNQNPAKGLKIGQNSTVYQTAELRIGGMINVNNDAVFANGGDGFISFYGNGKMVFGNNTKIDLKGKNQNDEVIRIGNGVILELDADETTIADCWINMSQTAQIGLNKNKDLLGIAGTYDFSNIKVSGGANFNSNIIKGVGIGDLNIIMSKFLGMKKGLFLIAPKGTLEARNTEFSNCETAIELNGSISTDNLLRDCHFLGDHIGLKINSAPSVTLHNTEIKSCQKGIETSGVSYLILQNQTKIHLCNKGILADASNIFLRSSSQIHLNTVGVEMQNHPYKPKIFAMGDDGTCGYLTSNGKGVIGKNILLDIDAKDHSESIFGVGAEIIPNHFEDNGLCFELTIQPNGYAAPNPTLDARGNYWGAPTQLSNNIFKPFNPKIPVDHFQIYYVDGVNPPLKYQANINSQCVRGSSGWCGICLDYFPIRQPGPYPPSSQLKRVCTLNDGLTVEEKFYLGYNEFIQKDYDLALPRLEEVAQIEFRNKIPRYDSHCETLIQIAEILTEKFPYPSGPGDGLENPYKLSITPNPVHGNFVAEYDLVENQSGQLLIKDAITGMVMQTEFISGLQTSKQVNVSSLQNGNYILEMQDANGEFLNSEHLMIH